MRTVTALLLVMMVSAALAQFVNLPPPPSMEDEESPAFVETDAESESTGEPWTGEQELENWEGRNRNSALIVKKAKQGNKKKAADASGLSAFDAFDWKKIPTDKQLPGDVVRLRHAPGAVPPLNEEVLPKSILPPPGCSDPNQLNDVKLWNTLTTKIKHAKVTGLKYTKWLKVADLAFKKVKAQIKLTKKNFGLIQKAVRGMTHQRRQIVKRLKAAKLKRDLETAQAKMKQLNAYGKVLGRTKSSLVEGFGTMNRRVKVLKSGMKQLTKAASDA